MSLSVNDNDTSASILSIKEIIGIVVVFSFMLYLVFPKKNIDDILKQKGKNANLSINYLESMLLYYPDNITLKMILLENYYRTNRIGKAFKLIGEIKKSTKDRKILSKTYEIEYQLLKERYFETNNSKILRKLKDRLYSYYNFQGENRDYLYFLGEAEQLDFPKLKYLALKGLDETTPELINFHLKQELYYLALNLGYKQEALEYLIELTSYKEADKNLKDSVLYSLLKKKDYTRALEMSKKLFLRAKDRAEIENYFNIALYITALKDRDDIKNMEELIKLYIKTQTIDAHAINYLMDNLLKTGNIKGASIYAKKFINRYKDKFNEKSIDLAIKALTYNRELGDALDIAIYAEEKFNNPEWLDRAITLATWQGKMDYAMELNIRGFKKYKIKKYEKYILKRSNFNTNYKSLGNLYISKLKSGDFSKIELVSKYFDYTADIEGGESFFKKLYRRYPKREILKELILFNYRNSHYVEGLKNFYIYRKRYGFDKQLNITSVPKLIALKRFREAYNILKDIESHRKRDKKLEELLKKLNLHKEHGEEKLYKELIDFANIFKDYKYLYRLLWKLEGEGKLKAEEYNRLALLEERFNRGKRVEYIYKKSFQKNGNLSHLMALLYLYMDRSRLSDFKKLIESLSDTQKAKLKRNIGYNLLLVNYYQETKQIKKGFKLLKRLLKQNRESVNIYQNYLWFIVNNNLLKEQKKALYKLQKRPKFREKVGFPAVILALQHQKSDLALRWIKPILKRDRQIEYEIVYSDILQLQNRDSEAYNIRRRVFKKIKRILAKSPKARRDKHLVSLYLRFVNLFVSPIERKNFYFKKYKSLFTDKEFATILAGVYSYSKSPLIVEELKKRHNLDESWLELYLAMSKWDSELKRKALKEVDILPFRDRAVANYDIGNIKEAQALAFKGLRDNSRDRDIFKIYKNIIDKEFPKGRFETKYIKLSNSLFMLEDRISYRWHLYKDIKISTFIYQYRYISPNSKGYMDSKLGIVLQNSYKNLIWSFEIAKHFAKRDFISSIINLQYRYKRLTVKLKLQRGAKTTQNSQLRMLGIQTSTKIEATHKLSNRASIGISYKKSQYKHQITHESRGNYQELKVNGSYLFRASYPDIRFGTYLLISRFKGVTQKKIDRDLVEIGSSVSVGESRRYQPNRDFRPFGVFNLSYNNRQSLGTNLTFGFSKEVTQKDIFNFSFNYSKSIDVFNQSYYGVNLNYLFD